MQPTTAAVPRATGGAGATRTCVELATTLARAGHEVAVLDADLATQGLAARTPGRIDPDVTQVLVGEASIEDALVERPLDLEGTVAVCPARAPFERLARAATPEAARRFEAAVERVDELFEYVLIDTPPVTTNLAVSAVTVADRVAAVTPASERGEDGLQRLRERLRDVGAAPGLALATRATDGHPVEEADVSLPTMECPLDAAPICAEPDTEYAPPVAAAAEALFGVELELSFEEDGLLAGRFG